MTGTAESLDLAFRADLVGSLRIQPAVPVLAPAAHAVRGTRARAPRTAATTHLHRALVEITH